MVRRAAGAGAGARGSIAGDLYRAANGPVLARRGGADRKPFGECRTGPGCGASGPLSGRGVAGPAFADCAALPARTAGRVRCRVRLVAMKGRERTMTYHHVRVTPLSTAVGAEISDVDLTAALPELALAEI